MPYMELWNVCSYGRKTTPWTGMYIFCYTSFNGKRSRYFPEVQNFMLYHQTCVINARLWTKQELFHNPRGKKWQYHIKCDYDMMEILICDLQNQGKNMVTIPWTLKIHLLVTANFARCMQETKLVKNIYSHMVGNSSFPR